MDAEKEEKRQICRGLGMTPLWLKILVVQALASIQMAEALCTCGSPVLLQTICSSCGSIVEHLL